MSRSVLLLLALVLPAAGAIDPQHFMNRAPEQLRLRLLAQVIEADAVAASRGRRVTLVAEVVEVRRGGERRAGDVVVVDYVIDLQARRRAQAARAVSPPRPGPQLLYQPDPPVLEPGDEFEAFLAPAAGPDEPGRPPAGAVRRERERLVAGPVYRPAAAQYSFAPQPRGATPDTDPAPGD